MNEAQKKQFLDMDLYELFGVEESATIEQIKKAYRKRALELHPDKNPNNKEEAENKFVALGKALEVLGSEACRDAYDAVRKSRREKAKRDDMLNEKQRALKKSLEDRERVANERSKKMTEDMKKSNAEERYQKEVDRLRNEGSFVFKLPFSVVQRNSVLKIVFSFFRHLRTTENPLDLLKPIKNFKSYIR